MAIEPVSEPAEHPERDQADRPWLHAPVGWTDALTSTDGPMYWARLLSSETARIRRYRRPATVVLIDVVGLDPLAALWGSDVAVQCLVQVARTISRQVRSSDHAARIGATQFGVYLPETNEIDAINFVERTRAAIAGGLGPSAATVTIAIGWASPAEHDLEAAVGLAEQRLEREAGRGGAI